MAQAVKAFNKAWWSEVHKRIIGAVVFINDSTAECLHWEGGLLNLIKAGAVMVKSLSSFEYCPKKYKKAVFITHTTTEELNAIREVILHSYLSHCILISCISLDVVYFELNIGRDVSDAIAAGRGPQEATKTLEGILHEWLEEPCKIDVVHIPISAVSLTNVIFTTPPFKSIFPLLDGNPITTPVANLYELSSQERSRVRRLASGLNSMMEFLNLREEIYFMGAYSSMVASVLENSPVCLARKKSCREPGALIILDRTLDMSGVTSYYSESVLDKIMAVLPRFPGHGNDVAVDMSSLCQANTMNHPNSVQLSPGCIYHATDESCVQSFDHMINKSQKEVLVDLYNKLSKIDVENSPSPQNLLRVTPQSLEKIVNRAKGNYNIIKPNLGLLQQALAIIQTLKSPRRQLIELIQSLEKQVLESLTASKDSTSVLYQITNLIVTRKERDMPLDDLLALIIHVYSLTGTDVSFSQEHEESLMKTLSVALYEDYFSEDEPEPDVAVTPEAGVFLAKEIMSRLRSTANIRKPMKRYNSVLKPCEDGNGEEYKGVFQQLVEDLVNSDRPELKDLSHHNEGIRELLLTRLSMLTSKRTRPVKHPMDYPLVIIYIIGGVTAEECKRLHRAVITSGVDNTVLFGSTKLTTPIEAMKEYLRM